MLLISPLMGEPNLIAHLWWLWPNNIASLLRNGAVVTSKPQSNICNSKPVTKIKQIGIKINLVKVKIARNSVKGGI